MCANATLAVPSLGETVANFKPVFRGAEAKKTTQWEGRAGGVHDRAPP